MRDLAVMLWGIYGFIFCVNLGFYFIGNAFDISAISSRSIDFEELNGTLVSSGESLQSGGFNDALIFGDFGLGATQVWNLFSGGSFLTTMGNMGFSDDFVFPLEVIVVGLLPLGTVIYYISGRQ